MLTNIEFCTTEWDRSASNLENGEMLFDRLKKTRPATCFHYFEHEGVREIFGVGSCFTITAYYTESK